MLSLMSFSFLVRPVLSIFELRRCYVSSSLPDGTVKDILPPRVYFEATTAANEAAFDKGPIFDPN